MGFEKGKFYKMFNSEMEGLKTNEKGKIIEN
jgi:hypothetical protein